MITQGGFEIHDNDGEPGATSASGKYTSLSSNTG